MNNPHNYPPEAIDAALRMKGGRSRKVSFRYELLNRLDVPIGGLDGMDGGTVSWGEFRRIKRSATFSLNPYQQRHIDFLNDRIRPWFVLHMDAERGVRGGSPDYMNAAAQRSGDSFPAERGVRGGSPDYIVEWPLGIFLLESPEYSAEGFVSRREIGAYDKSIIIEQDCLTRRLFFAKGTNYVGAVTQVLATAGLAHINIPPHPGVMRADREFPTGMKKHLVVNELLRAINYTSVWVDRNGFMRARPYVEPSQRPVSQIYTTDADSITAPRFTRRLDIASRANVFTRVAINPEEETELYATFVNDNPASPISTVNRGRKIVDFEEIHDIAGQDALDGLVRRLAVESTSAFTHLTFGTALMPTHQNADTLLCTFPELFEGSRRFSETSWTLPLQFDGIMQHEARMVVDLTAAPPAP